MTNQRVTLGKGWRKEGSRTCKTKSPQKNKWNDGGEKRRLIKALSNLFVEPEHGADNGDVSEANPLSNQEGAGAQMLVQHCEDLLHILLGLLCSLEWPTWTVYYQVLHKFEFSIQSSVKPKLFTSAHQPKMLSTNATWQSINQKILNCKPVCWTAWFQEWEKPMHWLEGWSLSQQSSPTAAPELQLQDWFHAVHHCPL